MWHSIYKRKANNNITKIGVCFSFYQKWVLLLIYYHCALKKVDVIEKKIQYDNTDRRKFILSRVEIFSDMLCGELSFQ